MNLEIIKNNLEIFEKKMTDISKNKPFTEEWQYYHNSIRSVLKALNVLNDIIIEKDKIIAQNFRDNLKICIDKKKIDRKNIDLEKENNILKDKCLSLEKQIENITNNFK